jgi:DNA-directed RNA polymerase specialized sigma24 family protein
VDVRNAAVEFERHRAHLIGVAYWMLGTLTDAEDAVQETYLRFARWRPAHCGTCAHG